MSNTICGICICMWKSTVYRKGKLNKGLSIFFQLQVLEKQCHNKSYMSRSLTLTYQSVRLWSPLQWQQGRFTHDSATGVDVRMVCPNPSHKRFRDQMRRKHFTLAFSASRFMLCFVQFYKKNLTRMKKQKYRMNIHWRDKCLK